MIAWIFSRIGSGSGSGARRQLSLDQIEGRTKIGLGRITPISDTDEMGELLDNDTESNGDPGAIRGASLKGESRPLRSATLVFGDRRGLQGKAMVTRARFERATPSFGGCSGNPVTYRCYFAIRKTWFGPVVP